jgi:hypothetical protein
MDAVHKSSVKPIKIHEDFKSLFFWSFRTGASLARGNRFIYWRPYENRNRTLFDSVMNIYAHHLSRIVWDIMYFFHVPILNTQIIFSQIQYK